MLSVVIPCYEMNGDGVTFLLRNLEALKKQSFKDFEVVIADNSDDMNILKSIMGYGLDIKYFKNPKKGISNNLNAGIERASGKYIRIIAQDDYLAHEDALKDSILDGKWRIVGCDNNPEPYWTGDMHQGNNKLGGLSCICVKKDAMIPFDPELKWLLDCDFYKRMYDLYGEPDILNGINVFIGVGKHQQTSILSLKEKELEVTKLKLKYV